MAYDTKAKEKFQKTKLEALMNLRGFIGETVENLLCDGYTPTIVDAVEKYQKIGPGFTYVATAAQKAMQYKQEQLREASFELEMINDELPPEELSGIFEDAFLKWYLDQTVKYETERYHRKTPCVWSTWQINRKVRHALCSLTALEERVLHLYQGLEDGIELMEEDVAELPEFQCDAEYMESVVEDIWKKFSKCNADREDFEEVCQHYRDMIKSTTTTNKGEM